METDMNSTTKQSSNSAAKEANEFRSLTDEELDVVSGAMPSDFICDVKAIIMNSAFMEIQRLQR